MNFVMKARADALRTQILDLVDEYHAEAFAAPDFLGGLA